MCVNFLRFRLNSSISSRLLIPSTIILLLFDFVIFGRHLFAMTAGPSSRLSASMTLPMFSGVSSMFRFFVSCLIMSPIVTMS